MEESSGSPGSKIVKTVPVIRDLTLNPSCKHGPTILFERDGKRFFSCSAYRSRKLCEFYMPEEKWKSGYSKEGQGSRKVIVNATTSSKKRSNSVLGQEAEQSSVKKRKTVEDNHPLAFPNQRDKGEAQYHFNTETVDFFLAQFEKLNFDSILCVGTPSLHKTISEANIKTGIKSFLLDLDERFASIYKSKFARYNMCNHHFFQTSKKFEKFLAQAKNLAVIIDPPFGVKAELIWHGCVAGVKRDFLQQNESDAEKNLGINFFWIFPYFMEGHIIKCSEGALRMSDFHVEYKNHAKFNDGGSKSKSSPVRIFTTVPLSDLEFQGASYRFCDTCSKWVDKQNLHCGMCETCTTKDGGGTYIHCFKCEKCVKPSWKHCWKCSVCHLTTNSCKNAKQSKRNDKDESSSKQFNVDTTKIKKTKRKRQKDEDFSNIAFKMKKRSDKQNSRQNRKREQTGGRNKKTSRIK